MLQRSDLFASCKISLCDSVYSLRSLCEEQLHPEEEGTGQCLLSGVYTVRCDDTGAKHPLAARLAYLADGLVQKKQVLALNAKHFQPCRL